MYLYTPQGTLTHGTRYIVGLCLLAPIEVQSKNDFSHPPRPRRPRVGPGWTQDFRLPGTLPHRIFGRGRKPREAIFGDMDAFFLLTPDFRTV